MHIFLLSYGCFPALEERNFPPDINLLHPISETVYSEGEELHLEVVVSDPNDKSNQLSVSWTSDIEGFLIEGRPNGEGYLKLIPDSLRTGPHILQAMVQDPAGESDFKEVNLVINARPILSTIRLQPEFPSVNDTLEVQVLESFDAEGDNLAFRFSWYKNGILLEEQSTETLSLSDTQKGDVIKVKVTPFDGNTEGNTVEQSVEVVNTPAVFESIAITPSEEINTQSTLSCQATATDEDGDEITLRYTWERLVDGFLSDFSAQGNEITLTPEQFKPNNIVRCRVQALENGEETTETSTQISIANSAPNIEDVLIVPSTGVRAGTTLTCTATTSDRDFDSITMEYRWLNAESLIIGIHDSLTITTEHGNKGDALTCQATATDANQGTVSAEQSVQIQNTPPSMSEVGLNPQSPTSQDSIECVPLATDIDNDTLTYTYIWKIDNILQSESSSILSGPFAVGSMITCSVVPHDDEESGTSMGASVSIINTAPQVSDVVLSHTEAYTNDQITVSATTQDIDGDDVVMTYIWYVDGQIVKQGLGNSLDGTQAFDKNEQIWVEVIPNDGQDDGTALTSSVLNVLNSPPEAPTLYISPSQTAPNQNPLICVTDTFSDIDGDSIDYEILWSNDGTLWNGSTADTTRTGDTLAAEDINDGDIWSCTVTLTDAQGAMQTVESNAIAISCSSYYGQSESCPATSCNDILIMDPSLHLADGTYWLTYDRTSGSEVFEAYCNMTYDGGGWTLAMKFDDATTDLHYSDPAWTTYSLLNETDITPNVDVDGTSAKFEAYNGVVGDIMRLEYIEPIFNIDYDLAGRSLLELFSGPEESLVNVGAGCGDPDISALPQWDANYMRLGSASEFFGVNGDWTGSVGGTTQTHSMRFGFGATTAYHHLWMPMIGIGIYASSSYNGSTSEDYDALVWREVFGSCSICSWNGCYGNGLGYEITDTSANLWVR